MAEIDGEELMRYTLINKEDEEDKLSGDGKPKKKGWRKIALTKNPAIIVKGMAFSNEQEVEMRFSDDVLMRIAAPIAIPGVIPRKPIVPKEGEEEFNEGKPFEVEFTREWIEESLLDLMSEPERLRDIFDHEHDASVAPAYIFQVWIVERPTLDKSYTTYGVKCIPGTAFAVLQFTDREYYEACKAEGCTGLSVQGWFGMELQMAAEDTEQKSYADVIVLDSENKVLMLKRRNDDTFEPGVWGLPGGKIEPGESALAGATRELMEEAGLEFNELEPVDVIDNGDGTSSSYFSAVWDSENPPVLSEEHTEFKFFSAEELKDLPVIMGQNERFYQLVTQAINNQKTEGKMADQEFELDGKKYRLENGKPVLVEEAEVAAASEEGKEKEKEAEVAAAEETPATAAAGLTKEDVVAIVTETVKPMIEDAMKAVIDNVQKEDDAEANGGTDGKEAEMGFTAEQVGGGGKDWYDYMREKRAQ